jgi:hypothetical protein
LLLDPRVIYDEHLLNVLWTPEPVDPREWNAFRQQSVSTITTVVEGLTVEAAVVVIVVVAVVVGLGVVIELILIVKIKAKLNL